MSFYGHLTFAICFVVRQAKNCEQNCDFGSIVGNLNELKFEGIFCEMPSVSGIIAMSMDSLKRQYVPVHTKISI